MTVVLSIRDKNAIRGLQRSEVEATISGLRRFFSGAAWLGKSNYYARDTVTRLIKAASVTKRRRRNLAQYIGASVTLHAIDGWSYLGRAVSCILIGDTHRALHLATTRSCVLQCRCLRVRGSGYLVVSTSAHRLLEDTSIDSEALSFWWKTVGESRGFGDRTILHRNWGIYGQTWPIALALLPKLTRPTRNLLNLLAR